MNLSADYVPRNGDCTSRKVAADCMAGGGLGYSKWRGLLLQVQRDVIHSPINHEG